MSSIYEEKWDEIYLYASKVLRNIEGGHDILSSIIQIQVKDLAEPYERKISRLKVLLYDFDDSYKNTNSILKKTINDLLCKIENIENSNLTTEVELDPIEESKYKRLWESYKANSRFIGSSASKVFHEFEDYTSYKERCKRTEEFFCLIGEIVTTVSVDDLIMTRFAIKNMWKGKS